MVCHGSNNPCMLAYGAVPFPLTWVWAHNKHFYTPSDMGGNFISAIFLVYFLLKYPDDLVSGLVAAAARTESLSSTVAR